MDSIFKCAERREPIEMGKSPVALVLVREGSKRLKTLRVLPVSEYCALLPHLKHRIGSSAHRSSESAYSHCTVLRHVTTPESPSGPRTPFLGSQCANLGVDEAIEALRIKPTKKTANKKESARESSVRRGK
jgi:hypothetical protein